MAAFTQNLDALNHKKQVEENVKDLLPLDKIVRETRAVCHCDSASPHIAPFYSLGFMMFFNGKEVEGIMFPLKAKFADRKKCLAEADLWLDMIDRVNKKRWGKRE
jgi:hypothetical protein